MTINRFVSDESIVIENEMKKVKVLDYHFHSDSSLNLLQSIQPMKTADLSLKTLPLYSLIFIIFPIYLAFIGWTNDPLDLQ